MKKYIGVDLGGTNIKAALVDPQTGEITHFMEVPTQAWEGNAAVIQRISGQVETLIQTSGQAKSDFGGIGIGLPGKLDMEKGETLFLPNLPGNWVHVPVVKAVSQQTGLPVHLLNDVRAITFGEWKFGAGRGVETMACYAIGTGIGGGLVLNNHLYLGMNGTAGEIGHMTIDFNGPECGCGNHGCLETFASGPAIAAMGIKAVIQGLTTNLGEMVHHDLNAMTPEVIARAAREGDRIARDIYDLAGTYLGIGIGNTLVAVTPKRVVIAGGVAQAGELLLNPIRRTIRERVSMMPVEEVEVVTALLGNNAGVIGNALWALERESEKES